MLCILQPFIGSVGIVLINCLSDTFTFRNVQFNEPSIYKHDNKRERESRLPMIEPVCKYDVIEINPFEIKKSNRYSAINNYFVFFFEK